MYVKVVPYNPQWNEEYKKESSLIKEIVKDILIDIYHIGSTAVKGLAAKAIIDIMPVVRDINLLDDYEDAFESIGYECMGEFGIKGRRYFRKGGKNRTHQVHAFEISNSKDILRHLALRDYLRFHPEEASFYGELKIALAEKFPEDIEGYCIGKDAFVKVLESKAIDWYLKELNLPKP